MSNIKIALLGLGDIGQGFAENFLEVIQERGRPIEIVAVAHDDMESPIVMGFQSSGITVYQDALQVLELGNQVDIIFDLTGNEAIRSGLRQGLQQSGNHHTVIAPEVVAKLLWMFFDNHADAAEDEAIDMLRAVGY